MLNSFPQTIQKLVKCITMNPQMINRLVKVGYKKNQFELIKNVVSAKGRFRNYKTEISKISSQE